MQRALDGDFFSETFDFSFLEQAVWDIGTSNELQTLFLDQGLLRDPVTIAQSCDTLRQVVDAMASGAGADLGPIEFWLESCADGVVQRQASSDDIDRQLFCTWKEVRPAPHRPVSHRPAPHRRRICWDSLAAGRRYEFPRCRDPATRGSPASVHGACTAVVAHRRLCGAETPHPQRTCG